MMVKIRLNITVEYEANPEWYAAGLTPQQIMEGDLEAMKEDYSLIVSTMENNGFDITAEMI